MYWLVGVRSLNGALSAVNHPHPGLARTWAMAQQIELPMAHQMSEQQDPATALQMAAEEAALHAHAPRVPTLRSPTFSHEIPWQESHPCMQDQTQQEPGQMHQQQWGQHDPSMDRRLHHLSSQQENLEPTAGIAVTVQQQHPRPLSRAHMPTTVPELVPSMPVGLHHSSAQSISCVRSPERHQDLPSNYSTINSLLSQLHNERVQAGVRLRWVDADEDEDCDDL